MFGFDVLSNSNPQKNLGKYFDGFYQLFKVNLMRQLREEFAPDDT